MASNSSNKTIAVIGAGICGISATKCCLEQGLNVVVFEKTNYICGLWRYQESIDENGIASVMKSTVINTSKEMSALSDFPPPADFPNYMHNTLMANYFEQYAAKFNFTKYVRFRHQIVSIEMADDYDRTGRWRVSFLSLDDPKREVKSEIFDGVAICVGHHNVRNEPSFPGQERFKGQILHSHSLKSAKGFEDKTVVVVGIGNSGSDAAVELATVARQVYLSTRRGSWINRRVGPNGRPLDLGIKRIRRFIFSWLPFDWQCALLEKNLNAWFDHEAYQLKPKHRIKSAHSTLNDALPNKILCGTVKVKSDIDHFTEDGVVFKGEKDVTKCDAVVTATGYKVSIPFISQDLVPIERNKVRLYKFIFPPNFKHPHTLGILGLIQPVGPGIPPAELQCRYFALLNSGKLHLPDKDSMNAEIDRAQAKIREQFYDTERHTLQVNWIDYMDDIAREIGCSPPFLKYLFTDPKLFHALVFGSSFPYQYRLSGPNAWSGAREAILSAEERISKPLQTNATRATVGTKPTSSLPLTLAFVAFAYLIYYFFSVLFR